MYNDYLEDYKVMVSTGNDDTGSFKELFSVNGESYFWKTHTVSLKQFAGQKIYIAFVCTSLNKYILAIDNMYIGELDGYNFDVKIHLADSPVMLLRLQSAVRCVTLAARQTSSQWHVPLVVLSFLKM